MRVYISGAVTGTKDYLKRFKDAEKRLAERGFVVINPCKVNKQLPDDTKYEEYIDMCLIMLKMADIVVMLKGWEHSKGARLEYAYAEALGKDVYYMGEE